ncbi:transglutaminase family protein [Ruania alkalisoli]|uniref:Transglutaminase family protein n=1 Tax=Ruania alkalisoli TaxID=2779775 RepID=A0A7M1SRQ7_9MICO|nr:transglutaminase family protein [Ruania alkalisoli]QOR70175.1 transglutaminase family protein [Ruania alkalisoli]
MRRTVSAELHVTAGIGTTEVALQVALARVPGLRVSESLEIRQDGRLLEPAEEPTAHGGRMHLVTLDRAAEQPGEVSVRYDASVEDEAAGAVAEVPTTTADLMAYRRPSRYAQSDELFVTARRELGGRQGLALVHAVGDWVASRVRYVPGSSRVTDGAVATLLQGQGVCRDYAHLVVALLRALDVPARLAAVYAPGLRPMDFHAVAEAWVQGQWYAVDATRMAPRSAMARISTGRDAADTAFLSAYGAGIQMGPQTVTATVDGNLPVESADTAVQMP